MEPIILSQSEKKHLLEKYPLLYYDEKLNIIKGTLEFCLRYKADGITIKDAYDILIDLNKRANNEILPVVKETAGRILGIARRKKIPADDLHIGEKTSELCIIVPMKECERYPFGFDLKEFLNHLQEHFYWVSYRDRYEKEPWKGQGHGEHGLYEVYSENKEKYSSRIKEYIEKSCGRILTQDEFINYINSISKDYNQNG